LPDSSQFRVRNVFITEDVLVSNEVVFDVAAFQAESDPLQRVHIPTTQTVLRPQFWSTHLLQQMQKYGFDVIRTELFVGEAAIVAIKFDQIVLE